MGRALFIVAVLFIAAYWIFYSNFQRKLGITPNSSNAFALLRLSIAFDSRPLRSPPETSGKP